MLADRIAFVARIFYGDLGIIDRVDAPADSARSSEALAPHNDGTYFDMAPGLQARQCLELDCTGGETALVDGFRIAQQLMAENPDLHAALRDTTVPARFVDSKRHYETDIGILRHENDRLVQVQCNSHDRAPFPLCETTETFYCAPARFHELATSPEFLWEFRLREGDAVIFDNWRLLQGRKAFQGRSRKLASFYIDRDAYRSALRVATRLKVV